MESHIEKAKKIKLLICDVDGVLTDGHLIYQGNGEILKAFHVQDGFGLKLLQMSNVATAIITTCQSPIIHHRVKAIDVKHLYTGQVNKMAAYEELRERLRLNDDEIAMIGDDLPDLPLITRCGFGVAVANAHQYVLDQADFVTTRVGGHGAVREVCDFIMHAQQTLDATLKKYLEPDAGQ